MKNELRTYDIDNMTYDTLPIDLESIDLDELATIVEYTGTVDLGDDLIDTIINSTNQ